MRREGEGEEQANSERVREFSAQNCQSGKLTHKKKKKKVEGEGEHTKLGTAGERAGEEAGRRAVQRPPIATACECGSAAVAASALMHMHSSCSRWRCSSTCAALPTAPSLNSYSLSLSLSLACSCRISAARGKLLNSCERQLHKLTYSLSLPLHICLNLLWRDEIAKQTM